MKLVIFEKPSVAISIAKVIGATKKKNGYYEGNAYKVSWYVGHQCRWQIRKAMMKSTQSRIWRIYRLFQENISMRLQSPQRNNLYFLKS